MRYALVLLLAVLSGAQELPESPRPQARIDYSEHLTWKQTFKSKRLWLSEGVMAGSMAFDIKSTLDGQDRCPWLVEKNQFWGVGPRPTPWQLTRRDVAVFGIVSGVNLLASKYLSPWVTFGPAAGFSARHIQGGVEWMNCR